MKIVFDNADAVIPSLGGSRGMTGIPRLTTFAWVFGVFVLGIIAGFWIHKRGWIQSEEF